jgi:N-acylneuraminate cytidylyltransferase
MSDFCSNIAIIPARSGSKGLPRKNILPFCGKPLIAWTIEQAVKSTLVDRVIVSTDSEEIAHIATTYGAEVPFFRPDVLSSDTATTEDVLLHVCGELQNMGSVFDNIILLQCTSPIRFKNTIDNAVKQFLSDEADSLLSVCETHRFFWHDKQNPEASYDYINRPRRQDIKASMIPYMETGSIYITKVKKLVSDENRITGKISLFETDYLESFEIDNLTDFELCEFLAKKVMLNENL